MNVTVHPYLRQARLRVFEYDPGLIRLRRAGRIILAGMVALLPALVVSIFFGVGPRLASGAASSTDLTLVFPALIAAVLLSANVSGSSKRSRQRGMLRNLLGGVLISVPASLVAEGTFSYGVAFAVAAFLALYLRRFGPSWKGTGPIALFVFVLVPRLEIAPALLPRFWAALAVAFLSAFSVSFHVLPVRLVRSLLDCLARFLAAAAASVHRLRPRPGEAPPAPRFRKDRREMDVSLALWYEIASGVLPPKDPAWGILDGIADGQFRLGNLLRIARDSLAKMSAVPRDTLRRAGEVLEELESVLESARRILVIEGKVELDLARFGELVRRFRDEWEAGEGPISALDIQVGRFVVAMERIAVVLESIAGRARRLAGREGMA